MNRTESHRDTTTNPSEREEITMTTTHPTTKAGRGRHWLLALLASLLGLSLLAPPLASAAPTSQVSRSTGPMITVDDVKVWKGEEQDWNQNGDEPIVVNLMIRTTLGVKDSTRTAWVSEQPRELDSGVDNGDWVPVPNDQGDAHFTAAKHAIGGGTMAVRYLSAADAEEAYDTGSPLPADVVMVVSFAFDGDFSGQKTLMAFMNTLRTMMIQKVTPVFEAAAVPVDLDKLPQAMAAINAKVQKVTVNVWDILLNLDHIWSYVWKSGGDYDDLIGVSVIGYIPVQRDFVEGLPIDAKDVGLDRDWTISKTPRQKVADGWIDVPSRLGLLVQDSAGRHFTHVVQSDLPIEDHVGYDLRHWTSAQH